MQQISIRVNNLEQMEKFARVVADYFEQYPSIIFLDGDLGAGKTTFTKFFAEELGIKENVTSPTFNIFKRYQGKKVFLNHFDLYRIKENVYNQGFEEYWNAHEISIIEWSMYLPNEFKAMFSLHLKIEIIDENTREIQVLGKNEIIRYLKENVSEFIY